MSRTTAFLICGKKINLERKKIKSLRLKINPKTAEVFFSVPENTSNETIYNFVEKNINWIEKNQRAVLERIQKSKNLKEKNTLQLFGKTFELNLKKASRFSYKIEGDKIRLSVRSFDDTEIKRCINLLYKKELNSFIQKILPQIESEMDETVTNINYRTMKTKLGSCKPDEKKITLSTNLARHRHACIEMVLIHEIVHFKEFYHNAKFKNFMTKYCPNWRALRKEMKSL
ncbi:MAG: SprT family zinc-dependent metalloprotease [Treponemataceae bacterium]